MNKFTVVDLFAGCGGISRGFEWGGRFGTQYAVELAPHPAAAFRANVRNVSGEPPRVYVGDISEVARSEETIWREMRAAGISRPGELDVLAGGPPCQGFSRNGVRRYEDGDRDIRFYDDPRNHLYKGFLSFVAAARPKLVLVENVREFLNFGGGRFSIDLVNRFDELGYEVEFQKLCAADYGVPQVRHRVLFIATRRDVADAIGWKPRFPRADFVPASGQRTLLNRPFRTVRDAFTDLPEPSLVKDGRVEYAWPPGGDLSKLLRAPSGWVANHVARALSPKQIDRINAVGVGRMRDIDAALRTKAFYGSAYRRLAWDEPALTITTWVYHVGSGRFAHPDEDRGITMREAARLQTFDDAFEFPPLVNPASQMIGNAVPPLLAARFAEEFANALDAFYAAVKVPVRAVS